jgi:hypothetical protein
LVKFRSDGTLVGHDTSDEEQSSSRVMRTLDDYGTCDCDRPDCAVARAVRAAAADACLASVVVEYGPHGRGEDAPHLLLYPLCEWVCRSFPYRSPRPCPACGVVPRRTPAWAVHGATFGLNGRAYRVITVGSSNSRTRRVHHEGGGLHTEDFVRAELVTSAEWSLSQLPAACDDVVRSLRVLFDELPRFWADDLSRALH